MKIILSQKIDTKSSYDDNVFHEYHYPSRYCNQIHSGDIFVYYQGNRYDKKQRYYFGVGIIGAIRQVDDNYYAEFINTKKFKRIVSIYLSNGEYVEQLGCDSGRSCPPWQSSIRHLSEEAFEYILSQSGIPVAMFEDEQINELKSSLKKSIKEFYVDNKEDAIDDIIKLAKGISYVLKNK